jgi:hypothetical protein
MTHLLTSGTLDLIRQGNMSLAKECLQEWKMFDDKEEYLKMLRKSLGADADLIDKHRSFVDKSFDLDVSIPDLTKQLKAKK